MQDFYICMELFEERSFKDLRETIIKVDQPGSGILYYAIIIQCESQTALEALLLDIQFKLLPIYPPPSGSTLLTPLLNDKPVEVGADDFRYYGYHFFPLTPEKAMAQWSNAQLAMAMHHYFHWLKSPDAQLEVPTDRAGVFLRQYGGITQAVQELQPSLKRKMTVADAAYTVLKEAGKPLKVKDILVRMQESGLWEPGGDTPINTIWATLRRDILSNGKNSLFRQPKKGYFEYNPQRTDYEPEELKSVDTSTYAGRFAVRLRELRERAGVSSKDVASAIGVTLSVIYSYENGKYFPPVSEFPKIASLYNIPKIKDLLPDE